MKPLLILLATALTALTALAAPYSTGDQVAPFTAKDQHKRAFTLVPQQTHYILVSHDMDTGKSANKALDALGKAYLPSKNAIFIANIHGMPAIGRTFALPKMRKYAHRIILGDDAKLIAHFPQQKGKVTILTLASGKVSNITYWNPANQKLTDLLK